MQFEMFFLFDSKSAEYYFIKEVDRVCFNELN